MENPIGQKTWPLQERKRGKGNTRERDIKIEKLNLMD